MEEMIQALGVKGHLGRMELQTPVSATLGSQL